MSTKIKGTSIELDFNTIKNNLKEFLSSQSEFTDYNFEGSGMSVLLDILAYNTHMNALTAHLTANDLYLQSGVMRTNVVANAKSIGYVPFSASSAKATITITVTPPSSYTSSTASLIRGTKFNGGGLKWIVLSTTTAIKNESGKFVFENVKIAEGSYRNIYYYYDSRISYPTFQIPTKDVDISTLNVHVKDSEDSNFYTSYSKFSSFTELNSTSNVYFLQENALEYYEVYFTNNSSIGTSPEHGNVIALSYIETNNVEGNGVKTFSRSDQIIGNNEYVSITTIDIASGGSERESVNSIRVNAPIMYSAQNRAVNVQDYITIVTNNYAGIETITAWGGEDNEPPEYGKVFLCIKPIGTTALTDTQKEYIINSIVKPKNVATITPEIIDPDYTYIKLNVIFKYNSISTYYQVNELEEMVKTTISDYNTNYLNSFDGVFRHSRLAGLIDNTELSIMNSNIKVEMMKKFTLYNNQDNFATLHYAGDLYDKNPSVEKLTSSKFKINGLYYKLKDYEIAGSNTKRQLKVIQATSDSSTDNILLSDAGYIDLVNRIIYVYGFRPDATGEIKIYLKSNSYDIPPRLNQLISIDMDEVSVTGEIDTIEVSGSSGSSSYIAPTIN